MNNNYLNEEKYQKINKKLSLVSKIVLVVGIGIGATLIFLGVNEKNKVKKENEQLKSDIKEEFKQKKEDNEKRLVILDEEVTSLEEKKEILNKEISELNSKKSDIFLKDGFSTEYNKIESEYNKKQDESFKVTSEINSKKSEIDKINSDLNSNNDLRIESEYNSRKKIDSSSTFTYFGLGGMAIFIGLTWSFSLFFMTKRRSIMAYQMQSIMPIAKEGMKEMAPTVGETAGTIMKEMAPAYKDMAQTMAPVYGEIAKEVGKGIAEGIKEGKSGDNNEQ